MYGRGLGLESDVMVCDRGRGGGGGRDWERVGRVVEAGGMRVEKEEVEVETADRWWRWIW